MDRGKESVMGLSSANMFMSAALGLFGRAFIMGGIIYIAVQCFLLYRDGRYAQDSATSPGWIHMLIAVIVIAVGVLCIWRS
jgi:hypothetical protein